MTVSEAATAPLVPTCAPYALDQALAACKVVSPVAAAIRPLGGRQAKTLDVAAGQAHRQKRLGGVKHLREEVRLQRESAKILKHGDRKRTVLNCWVVRAAIRSFWSNLSSTVMFEWVQAASKARVQGDHGHFFCRAVNCLDFFSQLASFPNAPKLGIPTTERVQGYQSPQNSGAASSAFSPVMYAVLLTSYSVVRTNCPCEYPSSRSSPDGLSVAMMET